MAAFIPPMVPFYISFMHPKKMDGLSYFCETTHTQCSIAINDEVSGVCVCVCQLDDCCTRMMSGSQRACGSGRWCAF